MNVINQSGKPFHKTFIFKFMKQHILEKTSMKVINVVKPLHIVVFFTDMKEHIPVRDPMNVINVVKPFQVKVIFNVM